MAVFQFVVDGPPIAQPRHQVQIRWKGTTAYPHHFVPSDHPVHAYKQAVSLQARVARPDGWPLGGPMSVHMVFFMGVSPDRHGHLYHHAKPDVDNAVKAVLDCLKGLAWNDDCQVAELLAVKRYAEPGDKPRLEVKIYRLWDKTL